MFLAFIVIVLMHCMLTRLVVLVEGLLLAAALYLGTKVMRYSAGILIFL
jgi:hypothetical protein